MSVAQTYNEVDLQAISQKTQDFMTSLGAQNISDVLGKIQKMDELQQYQTLSKMIADIMSTTYEQNKDYQRNTDLLAQLNEGWNANRYIVNSLAIENKRVGSLDAQAKRDIYKLRQKYMYTAYMHEYYDFAIRVVMLTLYATLLLLIPAAMWKVDGMNGALFFVIDGILLILYLVVLIVLFRNVGDRRKNAWRQKYWRVGRSIEESIRNQSDMCMT